jgi:hypothetical protein
MNSLHTQNPAEEIAFQAATLYSAKAKKAFKFFRETAFVAP